MPNSYTNEEDDDVLIFVQSLNSFEKVENEILGLELPCITEDSVSEICEKVTILINAP